MGAAPTLRFEGCRELSSSWASLRSCRRDLYPYVPPPHASAIAPSTEPVECEVANPYADVAASTVTALHFTTTSVSQQPILPPEVDVDVTVTDRAKVQAIFAETNALPCIPKPVPGELDVNNGCMYVDLDYHLVFRASDGTMLSFDVDPGNCGYVSAAGTPWAYVAGTYAQDLATTLGVPRSDLRGL